MIYCLVLWVPAPSQDLPCLKLLPCGTDQTYLGVNSQLNERQEFLQEHPSRELSYKKRREKQNLGQGHSPLPHSWDFLGSIFMFKLIATQLWRGLMEPEGRNLWEGEHVMGHSRTDSLGKCRAGIDLEIQRQTEVWISTCRIILASLCISWGATIGNGKKKSPGGLAMWNGMQNLEGWGGGF